MAAAPSPSVPGQALSGGGRSPHPHEAHDQGEGEAIRDAFAALAGQDGTQVSIDKLRSILQDFDLNLGLDEALRQLQDSRPRMAHLDEPLEVLTLKEFSNLFK